MLLLWLLHIGPVVVFCNHNSLFLWSPRNTKGSQSCSFLGNPCEPNVCPGSCHLQETPIHLFIRHQWHQLFGFPSPNLAFSNLLYWIYWIRGAQLFSWMYQPGKVRYLQSRPGGPAAQAAQLCCGHMAKWTSRRALQYLWFLMILLFTDVFPDVLPSGYLLHSHGMDGPNRNRFIDDFPSELKLHWFWGFSMAMVVITRCVPWVAPSDSEWLRDCDGSIALQVPSAGSLLSKGFPGSTFWQHLQKNKPLFLPMNLFWWPRNFITSISSIIFWLLLLAASSESVLNVLYWGYADNPQGRIWPHISTMEEGGSASSRVTSGRILDQWINQRKKMRSCFQNHPKPYHNSLIHCICGKLSAIFIHAHSIIWDFNPSFMVGLWQPVALVGARPRHPKW